jgi:hypothetical protein
MIINLDASTVENVVMLGSFAAAALLLFELVFYRRRRRRRSPPLRSFLEVIGENHAKQV